MPVFLRRSLSTARVLLTALLVVGLVGFVSTPSFAATPGPRITAVSPNAGSLGGGGFVTVSGTGFTSGTMVYFGSVTATNITVVSASQLTATVPAHTAGVVDVHVVTAFGLSPIATADRYTYQSAPTVTGVALATGHPAGGDTVTVTGTGFLGITEVDFGSQPGTSISVASSTQLTVVSPAEPEGTVVDVRVAGSYGTSAIAEPADSFTFEPAPSIDSLSSSVGVVGGGSVVITGSKFFQVSSVTFGGIPATGIVANAAGTQITVTAPAQPAGSAPVVVSGAYGETAPQPYNYFALPIVSKVSVASGLVGGPLAGGTPVTITGSGFANATAVLFGTTSVAVSPQNDSDSSLTVTAPAHAAGAVDVRVVLGDGTSVVVAADRYTYYVAPVVTAVAPATGVLTGGTTVTITGTGFVGVSRVTFGGASGSILSVTATKLTVTAPAAPVTGGGQFDIQVTGTGGTSAVAGADHYTYIAAPVVTAVSPTLGVVTGGGTVTLTGTGFTGATKVMFGTVAAKTISVKSATTLTVVPPAHIAQSVHVFVTGPYGVSRSDTLGANDNYQYLAVPTITQTTNAGSVAGGSAGQLTRITGTGFGVLDSHGIVTPWVSSVLFGTTAGTSLVVTSPTTLTVIAPAHAAGTVDLRLVLGTGMSAITAADKYTYQPLPAITKVSPAIGKLTAGTSVTLTGTGFFNTPNAVTVTVGGVAATNVKYVSATSLTFVVPPTAATGTTVADVVVTDSYGSSPVVAADRFTYEAAPSITLVSSPAAGALVGGNTVTITGTNFVGVTGVTFGTTASAKVVTVSPTQLTVTVPAHVAGVVDVQVVTPYGSSPTASADQYTFQPLPTITAVSPSAGSPAGLTTVTIQGTGFVGAGPKVQFGTFLATNVAVQSPTQLTATVPAHAAGTVDVQVIGAYGVSPVTPADRYIYQADASIAGTVTGPGSGTSTVTLAGVQVSAWDSSGNFVASATTGPTGAYLVAGLGTGNYSLDFTPADSSYAPQWYMNQVAESLATPIAVVAGQAVTGKSVVLTRSASITGTVQGSGSAPLTDVTVTVYDASGTFAGGANTTSDGSYAIPGLSAGTYSLRFAPQFGTADASVYAPQSQAGITITAGQTRSVPVVTLVAGSTITGTVTDDSSGPAIGVSVSAFTADGTSVASTLTRGDGSYTLGGLAAGSYTLKFTPGTSAYAPQWLGGAFEDTATVLAIDGTSSYQGEDTQLAAASLISGDVYGAGGAEVVGATVVAYDSEGDFAAGALDGASGYEIDGLPAGTYTLDFIPPTSDYASAWFGGSSTQAESTTITVPGAASGTDITLAQSGSISGNVLGSGTTPVTLSNVSVTAFDPAGNAVETASTDSFGHYTLAGLPADDYTVDFVPNSGPYGAVWWNGASTRASATVIPVDSGEAVTGVNVTLIGASISGAVAGTNGVPLAGVRVYAVDAAGNGLGQATTSSLGTYSITGIPAGSYTLEFVPPSNAGYKTQWLGGQAAETGATFVALTAGLQVTGKSVTLSTTTLSISGQVTDAGTALPFLTVELFDAAGNWVAETTTLGGDDSVDGTYSFTGLAPGSYALFVSGIRATGSGPASPVYVDQWFSGKATEATATLIAVTTASATSKNVTMTRNGSILGYVQNGDTTDAAGVKVDALNAAGTVVASAIASPGGSNGVEQYGLYGLVVGSYTLEFTEDGYATQWYVGQSSRATATVIKIATVGSTVSPSIVTMAAGATINGTVTVDAPGSPDGIQVDAYDSTGAIAGSGTAVTDGGGNYSIANLPAGTYTLEFAPSGTTPWWYGQSRYGAQAAVTITAAQAAAGASSLVSVPTIDLSGEGSVSGRVTSDGSSGLPGVGVTISDATGNYQLSSTTTAGDGSYTLTQVPAGHYYLTFAPGDGFVAATSPEFAVSTGQVATGEDEILAASGTITGTVSSASSPNVADVTVTAFDGAGDAVGQQASTAADGSYSITDLPAGSYTLKFVPDQGTGLEGQWYGGTTTRAGASYVAVGSGATFTAAGVQLDTATGSISGTMFGAGSPNVTLAGAVQAFDANGDEVATDLAASDGIYSLTGLGAGTYTLEFEPNDPSYAPYWWNGQTSAGSATPVTLGAGKAIAGISPVLPQGATISGTLYTAGTPNAVVPFGEIDLYDAQGNELHTVYTNAVGHYSVAGVAPGKYTLYFPAPSTSFAGQWFGGATLLASATMITILGDQQVTGKNAVLTKTASISGTITDGSTGSKLDHISVLASRLEGATYVQEFQTATDADGSYTLELPAGTYKVGFADYSPGQNPINSVYGDEFWNLAPTLASAKVVAVTAGQVVTAISAGLTKVAALAALTAPATPTVTGTAAVGSTLTAATGTWAPAPVVLTYQWERNGAAIAGATASTYTPTSADECQSLTVVVTGHRVGYRPTPLTSDATSIGGCSVN